MRGLVKNKGIKKKVKTDAFRLSEKKAQDVMFSKF